MLGYLKSEKDVADAIKEWQCNQSYLAAIKYGKQIAKPRIKNECEDDKMVRERDKRVR